jgi:uncharacterized protein (DUF1684 family)
MTEYESLLDYRRAVAALYARVRQSDLSPAERCAQFRRERDELFRTHPQSALSEEQKAGFAGLHYFPYDPAYRFVLAVDPDVEPAITEIDLQDDGRIRLKRFGKIHFAIDGQPVSLFLYWIMAYGGGIFLSFRDSTSKYATYGGGRYVLDTIKQADLGHENGRLVIDFNCAYNPRWVCPLPPAENWLPVPIPAGERRWDQ